MLDVVFYEDTPPPHTHTHTRFLHAIVLLSHGHRFAVNAGVIDGRGDPDTIIRAGTGVCFCPCLFERIDSETCVI